MSRNAILAVLASIALFGCATQPIAGGSAFPPNPVRAGLEYDILSFRPTDSPNTVYMLRCKNGTNICGYKWDELCVSGKATNTNPFGTPDTGLAYMRDKENRPMRIFICI